MLQELSRGPLPNVSCHVQHEDYLFLILHSTQILKLLDNSLGKYR